MAWNPFDWLGIGSSGTPGINPNPTYGQTGGMLGYDPNRANRMGIAQGLLSMGAGIANAPRGQGIGGAATGFGQGMLQGQQNARQNMQDQYVQGKMQREQQQQQAVDAFNQAYQKNPNDPQLKALYTQAYPDQAASAVGDQFFPKAGESVVLSDGGILVDKATGKEIANNPKEFTPSPTTRFVGSNMEEPGYYDQQMKWHSTGQPVPRWQTPQGPTTASVISLEMPDGTTKGFVNSDVEGIKAAVGSGAKPPQNQGLTITQNPDGTTTVNYGNKAPTETQSVTSGYYDRAQNADAQLAGVLDKGYSPSLKDLAAYNSGSVGNFALGDKAQQFFQSQRNFINALLRRESGAVISPSEFDNAQKQYFPQPGDSDAVLKQKAENRKQAIDSLKRASGPAATMVAPPAAAGAPNVSQNDVDPLGLFQ